MPEIDFDRLDFRDLERLVLDLLTRLGFTIERGREAPDGGFGLIARDDEDARWMIEAKQYGRTRVGLRSVNELVGNVALNGIDPALIVTSGQLTSAAFAHAQRSAFGRAWLGTT